MEDNKKDEWSKERGEKKVRRKIIEIRDEQQTEDVHRGKLKEG